jgi:hypothetical protein
VIALSPAATWSTIGALIVLAVIWYSVIAAHRFDERMDPGWLAAQERRKVRFRGTTPGDLHARDSGRAEAANHPSVWRSGSGDDAA